VDRRLEPFDRADAATVLSWARSPTEREAWASIHEPDPDVTIFDRWHAGRGVRAFGFVVDGTIAGYGEIWEDPDEHEVELARLIVDPAMRRRGFGRAMVGLLSERARGLGHENVWIRVLPSNAPAIRTYSAAGFVRATPEEESRFNDGQPHAYVWMRLVNRPTRLIRRPLAGDLLDAGGDRAFVVAEWSDDGSNPSLPIAPPHRHLAEDEAWYVLEGRLIIRIGEEELEAPAGTAVFGPRGVPHTYANPDPRPCRYLIVMQPKTVALIEALHSGSASDPRELFRAYDAELVEG
jgi:ribosomal protein S18 acetylase RimI-like enzyme